MAKRKQITGKIDEENFFSALSDIQSDALIDRERVLDILKDCMLNAYLSWSYPGLFGKDSNKNDPTREKVKALIIFDKKKFKIFDYKTVTNEDDIIDDAYQISLEDAKEIKASAKLGDEIKIPFDVKQLDKKYVGRVKQLFQTRIKEASKANILSLYQNQIHNLIQGTVTRIEGNTYELNFGKAIGILKEKDCIPGEHFAVNDHVLVYLVKLSDKNGPTTLVINRTSSDFIIALLKHHVPDIANGTIKIKNIARIPGKRTKVFVESTLPNVDPVGACIGPESGRMTSIINELKGEKIDVLKYKENKAWQIIEAMRPAEIIGMTNNEDFFDPNVHFDEIESEENYEYPDVTVIVNNGTQGIAIGIGGANVKLASKITKTSINIKQADEAIKDNGEYIWISDIEKLTNQSAEPAISQVKVVDEPLEEEIEEELKNISDEEIKPIETKKKEIVDLDRLDYENNLKEKENAKAKETKSKKKEKEVEEEVKEREEETPVANIEEVEHIEIKNKPKIKLEDLESALGSKKQAPKKQNTVSKKKKEEVVEKEIANINAMPIYTKEELESFKEEENYEEDDDTSYIDEEYEDYQ